MPRSPIVLCFVLATLQSLQGSPFVEKVDNRGNNTPSDYNSDDYYTSDDDYLDEQEKVVHRTPKFLSQGTNVLINEGDIIKLPCYVDKLDGFVLLWKTGKNIIAVGKSLINKENTRAKLEESENGNTLVISFAEPKDAGEYVCAISANKPTELRHSVRIRVPPEVKAVPGSGSIVVKEGEPATLACQILKGSPTPEITWRRRERKMPSGEEEIRGLSITFPRTTRHHSGHYICSADNGFAEPVSAEITLDVQHAPRIEQDQNFIHTTETDETEVVCIVHASPKAEVTWFKNGKPLTKDQGIISQRLNHHMLLLPGIKESTFGVYTCKATNKYGADEKTTEVSGTACPVNVKSSPDGEEKTSFALEWVVQSNTPVTSFRVQYKRVSDNYVERPENNEAYEDPARGGWTEVLVMPRNIGDDFYSGKLQIENLQPASHYASRISSLNNYGFSSFSSVFRFGTKGAAPVQQPSIGNGSTSVKVLPHHVIALLFSSTLLALAML